MTGSAGISTVAEVIEQAPAKINLALHVTGRRDDGYHTLESVVTFANVVDRVRVSPSRRDTISLVGEQAALLGADEEGNLVARARDVLRAFCARSGGHAPAVAIELEKHLPVAGGLGGGSADAAATLRGLARLWAVSPTRAELTALATSIGADVPMCLSSRPLTACGVGEIVAPLIPFPTFDIVLVNPGIAVATPAVFAALERRRNPVLHLPRHWGRPDEAVVLLSRMRNDLQQPAIGLCPAIGEVLDSLERTGAALARMSGSGATCFGIFPRAEAAAKAAAAIRQRRRDWWVIDCRTCYGISGVSS